VTVGSANLNEHSLFNDTEMNIVTCHPRVARETLLRLWAEYLECQVEDVSDDAVWVIDQLCRPSATEQLERRERGEPPTHRLHEIPGVSRRSMALRGALDSLVVDG
jgi:phosphatidylserine/phosphatidylglycerophosphate/cardiolipin synthase-like enzyme